MKMVAIMKSFETEADLQAYISNIIKLSKMLNLHIYDEMNYSSNDYPFTSEIILQLSNV